MEKKQPSHGDAPAPRDKLQPVNEAAARTRLQFSVLLAAALIATFLPLPFRMVAVVFSLWASGLGIIFLIKNSGKKDPSTRLGQMAVGTIAALIISALIGSTFARWDLDMEYQKCLNGAVTNSAAQECTTSYQNQLEELTKTLTPTPSK